MIGFSTTVALACLFSAGCGSITVYLHFLRNPADRAIQEDDIRDFRYRIERAGGSGPFFLSIDRRPWRQAAPGR